MTRTFNLQLLRGKWVFPFSKPDTIAKLKLWNSLVRILDRHYCSSIVFIPCQYAHVHLIDDGTKRNRRKGSITTVLEQPEQHAILMTSPYRQFWLLCRLRNIFYFGSMWQVQWLKLCIHLSLTPIKFLHLVFKNFYTMWSNSVLYAKCSVSFKEYVTQ